MQVIIRLQHLPWNAQALDIRRFFSGLSIPEGGVHIVGGDQGNAFITFSSDEDARKAMLLNGDKILNVSVRLLLSSKAEMQDIVFSAHRDTRLNPSDETVNSQSIRVHTSVRDDSGDGLRVGPGRNLIVMRDLHSVDERCANKLEYSSKLREFENVRSNTDHETLSSRCGPMSKGDVEAKRVFEDARTNDDYVLSARERSDRNFVPKSVDSEPWADARRFEFGRETFGASSNRTVLAAGRCEQAAADTSRSLVSSSSGQESKRTIRMPDCDSRGVFAAPGDRSRFIDESDEISERQQGQFKPRGTNIDGPQETRRIADEFVISGRGSSTDADSVALRKPREACHTDIRNVRRNWESSYIDSQYDVSSRTKQNPTSNFRDDENAYMFDKPVDERRSIVRDSDDRRFSHDDNNFNNSVVRNVEPKRSLDNSSDRFQSNETVNQNQHADVDSRRREYVRDDSVCSNSRSGYYNSNQTGSYSRNNYTDEDNAIISNRSVSRESAERRESNFRPDRENDSQNKVRVSKRYDDEPEDGRLPVECDSSVSVTQYKPMQERYPSVCDEKREVDKPPRRFTRLAAPPRSGKDNREYGNREHGSIDHGCDATIDFCVLVRGLPASYNYRGVRRCFGSCRIRHDGVKLVSRSDSRSDSSEAFLWLNYEADVVKALNYDGKLIEGKLLAVERCSFQEFESAVDKYKSMKYRDTGIDKYQAMQHRDASFDRRSRSPHNRRLEDKLENPQKYTHVVIKKLPEGTDAEDVRRFLEGIPFFDDRCPYMELSKSGCLSGNALVEFRSPAGVTDAMALQRYRRIKGTFVHIIPISEEEYHNRMAILMQRFPENADRSNRLDKRISQESEHKRSESSLNCCVFLTGIPLSLTTNDEIAYFFRGIEIVENGIHVELDDGERPTGNVYVQFIDEADCRRALRRNRDCIGDRRIEVIPCSYPDMMNAVHGDTSDDAPPNPDSINSEVFTLRLRNIHSDVQLDDVLEFFHGLHPIGDSVKLRFKAGRPTGDGLVSFPTRWEAEKAIEDCNHRLMLNNLITISWATETD